MTKGKHASASAAKWRAKAQENWDLGRKLLQDRERELARAERIAEKVPALESKVAKLEADLALACSDEVRQLADGAANLRTERDAVIQKADIQGRLLGEAMAIVGQLGFSRTEVWEKLINKAIDEHFEATGRPLFAQMKPGERWVEREFDDPYGGGVYDPDATKFDAVAVERIHRARGVRK